MKKNMIKSILVLVAGVLSAQQGKIGINTDAPKATMEIKVSPATLVGNTVEGVIIPQLSKNRVAVMTGVEESTLVYINDVTGAGGASTVNVIDKGFYYYAGGLWNKLSHSPGINIYNADGTLLGVREVNLNGNNLTFTGSGNIGIGTNAPENWAKLHTKGHIYAENGHLVSSLSSNEGGSLSLRNPSKANSEASEWRIWNMIGGGYGHNSLQFWKYSKDASKNGMAMTLSDNGNVGIGYHMPAVKLHIVGTADHKLRLQHQGSADFTDIVKRSNGTFNIYNNVGGGSWAHGLSVSNAGNVGLGTETPGQRLHVEGNSYMNGWLHTTGGARISGTSRLHSGADLWVDGHTDTNTLNVRSGMNINTLNIQNLYVSTMLRLPQNAPCSNSSHYGSIRFNPNIFVKGQYWGWLEACLRTNAGGYVWVLVDHI